MLNSNLNIGNYTIISIYPEEEAFFEEFLTKQQIHWAAEHKESNIVVLSKALTGYIHTPQRKIEILPKYREVSIQHILRLYNYVYSYKGVQDDELLDISESNRADNLIETFLTRLEANISIGLLQEYRLKAEQQSYLKGRVDFVRTYSNMIRQKKHPVVTDIHRLSLNIDINQLIVGALLVISKTKQHGGRAQDLLGYFDEVEPIQENAGVFLEEIHFNSKNSRYQKIASEAAMIIDALYYDDKKGAAGGESFLMNFDRLFEDFIAKILVEETPKREFITLSKPLTLGTMDFNGLLVDSNFYQPDLLYRFQLESPETDYKPSAFAVLDVKNKAHGTYKNADLYQIALYTKMLHAKKSILIYPSFSRKRADKLHFDNKAMDVPTVHAVYIEITSDTAQGFKEAIKEFKAQVFEVLEH